MAKTRPPYSPEFRRQMVANWSAPAAIRMISRESSNRPRSRSATGSAWPIEGTGAGRRRSKLSHPSQPIFLAPKRRHGEKSGLGH